MLVSISSLSRSLPYSFAMVCQLYLLFVRNSWLCISPACAFFDSLSVPTCLCVCKCWYCQWRYVSKWEAIQNENVLQNWLYVLQINLLWLDSFRFLFASIGAQQGNGKYDGTKTATKQHENENHSIWMKHWVTTTMTATASTTADVDNRT